MANVTKPIALDETLQETNNQLEALVDAITSGNLVNVSYGTTDLTDGVSPLASGELYFQYE